VSDGDMDLIRARGAGIAHCPLSNVYFSNAVFPLRRALENKRPGLGGNGCRGDPSPEPPPATVLTRDEIGLDRLCAIAVAPETPPTSSSGLTGGSLDAANHFGVKSGRMANDPPVKPEDDRSLSPDRYASRTVPGSRFLGQATSLFDDISSRCNALSERPAAPPTALSRGPPSPCREGFPRRSPARLSNSRGCRAWR
jgi:hypothetical protein